MLFTWFSVRILVVCSSVDDCSVFSSTITDDSIDGDLSELVIGVRRVKKLIRFGALYRSRIELTSVFVGRIDEGDDDEVDARESVFVRIGLVISDESLLIREGGSLDFDALVALEEAMVGRFGIVRVFVTCWEGHDDEDLTLAVDDGLVERLRSISDNLCVCCNPDVVVGRGIKPKRGWVDDAGSDDRFVIDIRLLKPIIFQKQQSPKVKGCNEIL